MFSTKLTRAAYRATNPTSTSTTCKACLATQRPNHQRRQSSSKASCPPDNSTSKPTPAAKANAAEESGKAAAQIPVSERQPAQRGGKGRTRPASSVKRTGQADNGVKKATPAEPIDQFAGLPSVPSIQNADVRDLNLSSFFSLHRPISVTSGIPPPTTPESFSTLFTSPAVRQQQENPWEHGNSAERRPEDVIFTLHNTIENLENGARNAEDEGVRWEVIHESPSNQENVKHLDGAPRLKSLDELVAQFRPFRTPPPPQPFPDSVEAQKASTEKKASMRNKPKQKTFTTTITVTESTDADGQKTYSASSSPIVRLPEPEEQNQSAQTHPVRPKQPFLNRMYARQRAYNASMQLSNPDVETNQTIRREPSGLRQERIKMFLISVKRQRKLKMKKHKYKKLMKRTRNLRRRLERS